MKHIFSKISKIGEEVRAAEVIKVELSLASDLRKEMEVVSNGTNQAFNLISQAEVRLQKSLQDHKRILSEAENGLRLAKDLGADSLVSELEKLVTYSKENIKFVQDSIKKLSSIG
jgi:hypothetical protein